MGVEYSNDSFVVASGFSRPMGIAVDKDGNVFVSDTNHSAIKILRPDGKLELYAGIPDHPGSRDGPRRVAQFDHPCGLAIDENIGMYVADSQNDAIRLIDKNGNVSTVIGQPWVRHSESGSLPHGNFDGSIATGQLDLPQFLAIDQDGSILVTTGNLIRKVMPGVGITTIAGRPFPNHEVDSGADGEVAKVYFRSLSGIALDRDGSIVVVDTGSGTVRRLARDGDVSTVAGLAGRFGHQDGNRLQATFYAPTGVAIDSDGNIFISDRGNQVIRRIDPIGVVTTLEGPRGHHADGAEAQTRPRSQTPYAIAVAPKGLYYTDFARGAVMRLDTKP